MNNWFPKETVRHKREKIAEIIRNLAVTQNPEKKFHFPDLEFVGVGAGYSDDDDEDMESDEKDSDVQQPCLGSSSIVITSTGSETQLTNSISNSNENVNECKQGK